MYTFAPPTDSWTADYTYQLTHQHSEITDAYDYHIWLDPGYFWANTFNPHNYVQTTNIGPIKRLRCTFQIDALPSAGYDSIFGVSYSDDLGIDQENWMYQCDSTIYVDSAGKLSFAEGSAQSANGISINTAYALELYVYNDPARVNTSWQIWIDGVMWLEDITQQDVVWSGMDGWAYLQFSSGFTVNGARRATGGLSVTLHAEDIIFTIEAKGFCGWTMMAPGIA